MKHTIHLCALLICIISCTKRVDCKEEIINVKNFETEYGCLNTRFNLNINLKNAYTIIRSDEAYDNQVTGSCHPQIDFSQYDLVIGKQSTGNFNDTVLYDLRRTCPENKLTLTVDVIQFEITQPSTIVYHTLVPKLGNEESLNIVINIKN